MKKQIKNPCFGLAVFVSALFLGDFCIGRSANEIAYYNMPALSDTLRQEQSGKSEQGIELCYGTKIIFASVEDAQKILTLKDQYIVSLTPFDRRVRLNSREPVSEQEFLSFLREQALSWSQYEKTRIQVMINNLAYRLKEYDLNLPSEIVLIKTTGKEDGGAAYTRDNAIILPQNILNSPGGNLERLIIHELFHIFTRNNLKTREALYAVINFKKSEKVELPRKLLDIELTNPDVPAQRYCVEVEKQGESIKVIPMITLPNFDASESRPFFSYLRLELVEVVRDDYEFSYVRNENDEPVVFSAQELPDYFKKIGENTGYVIHPEEILADNFAMMVMGQESVKSKWVIDEKRILLANKSPRGVGVN